MSYALLGLLIVLVLAQAFLLWKAASMWRWYEMTAIMVTTILAVIFVFPVAGALKSRSAWYDKKEKLDARLDQAQTEQNELRNGDLNNPLSDTGVLAMSQKLGALGLEAGRRWRGLRLTNSSFEAGPSIVLTRAPSEPDADAGPEAEPAAPDADAQPLIAQGMVVYGFGEGRGPNIDVPVPVGYLGEFRVTSSTPNQVTLSPTGPLMNSQQELIESGKASSWSVYEMLPLDGHMPFIAEGSIPDDNNVFGRVDENLLDAILANASDATREDYLRDGSRARPDDPPLSRWVKVEFTKPYTISVDSLQDRNALELGFFDNSGRAADSRLKVGEEGNGEVKLAKGELLLVKKEAADAMRAEGVARLVDEYYVRPLNDYRYILRRVRLRLADLQNRSKILGFEKDVLQRAIDATVSMLASYQTDKLLLEQDFEQTETERKAIEAYNEELRARVKESRENLVRLYRSNQSLETELARLQGTIESEVNSLTTTSTR